MHNTSMVGCLEYRGGLNFSTIFYCPLFDGKSMTGSCQKLGLKFGTFCVLRSMIIGSEVRIVYHETQLETHKTNIISMLPRHRRCKGLASFKWISIRYYKYHAQVTGTKNSLKPCQTIKRKTSILTKNDFSINN